MACLRCNTPNQCGSFGCAPGTFPPESGERMWWEVAAEQNSPMPQSSKEKQEAFRARQAMLGNTEVRGIYAPPALHAAIKEAARKLVEQHKPGEKGPTNGA